MFATFDYTTRSYDWLHNVFRPTLVNYGLLIARAAVSVPHSLKFALIPHRPLGIEREKKEVATAALRNESLFYFVNELERIVGFSGDVNSLRNIRMFLK